MSKTKGSIGSVRKHLLIKSREAMMAAVQIYNNPLISFKSESFIVLSNIAWTYLLHAYYRSIKIDYCYYELVGSRKRYNKTKNGQKKHWELERCINCDDSPLDSQTSANLRFLIGIRHEIEHRYSPGIDETIRGKIQASCINYNYYIKKLFGDEFGVDQYLGTTVQFSDITPVQKQLLTNNDKLSASVRNFITTFESSLSDEEINGPRYEYRIVYEGYCSSRKKDADQIIQFIKCDGVNPPDSTVLFKEVEKNKHLANEIVKKMNEEGFDLFKMYHHNKLCSKYRGNEQYSIFIGGRWFWYDAWIPVVREHCLKNKSLYCSVLE